MTLFFKRRASLADEVVLPEPLRPTIKMRPGFSRLRRGVASEQRRQLVMENFDDLLTWCDAAKDCFPSAFSFTQAMNFLAT